AGVGGEMTVARAPGAAPNRRRLADHVTSPLLVQVLSSLVFSTVTLYKYVTYHRQIHHLGQCRKGPHIAAYFPERPRPHSADQFEETAVPGERFELPTNGLQNRCSTTELTRRIGASLTVT